MASSLPLPRFVFIKQYEMRMSHVAYRENYEGVPHSVILNVQGVQDTHAKIEVEPAKSDSKYVHLRFCYANKYWAMHSEDDICVADSDKPEEDTSKRSCTLFDPVKADADGHVYLVHVHTRWRAQFDGGNRMRVKEGIPIRNYDKLSIVDWDSIVRLPEHVAFKGDNGKYLRAVTINKHPFLQFSSDDPYDEASGFRVESRPDGYVRIKSDHTGKFWRLSPAWIWADGSRDSDIYNLENAFWPMKIDGDTIALRNWKNGKYCKRLTAEHNENCLNAAVTNTTKEARIVVQELVQERKIYGVIYRLENARIFDEAPYVGGSTTTYNKGDEEAGMEVELSYEDEKSTSFNRSVSVSAGVTTTIEAQVPEIFTASVQLSYNITGTLEWGKAETKKISVKAKGVVRVPARSMAVVHYVGTKGTCSVPYSYTQGDKSSTDGKIVYSTQNDGTYTGVNCYNFQFVVEKALPI